MIEIIPSILTDNLADARQKITVVKDLVKRVHIDIIDGKFADNKTIIPAAFDLIETNVLFDYHLMVSDPIDWLNSCSHGQADRVIAQQETIHDQFEFLEIAQEYGFSVGLALDLDTQVEEIEREILTDLDVVLIMSVKAGYGGQEFNPQVLEKVKQLVEIKKTDSSPFSICIDGGITTDTIKQAVHAGIDEAVSGRLFHGDFKTNLAGLVKAANE